MDAYDQRFTREMEWGDLRDGRFEACTFEGADWSRKDLRDARFDLRSEKHPWETICVFFVSCARIAL